MKNDPLKRGVRKLTFTVIGEALLAIARGEGGEGGTEEYDRLPFNGKRAYEVIVRNVTVETGSGRYGADLGISRQVDTHPEDPPRLVDAGDLSVYSGLEEFDAEGARLPVSELRFNEPFEYGKLLRR